MYNNNTINVEDEEEILLNYNQVWQKLTFWRLFADIGRICVLLALHMALYCLNIHSTKLKRFLCLFCFLQPCVGWQQK